MTKEKIMIRVAMVVTMLFEAGGWVPPADPKEFLRGFRQIRGYLCGVLNFRTKRRTPANAAEQRCLGVPSASFKSVPPVEPKDFFVQVDRIRGYVIGVLNFHSKRRTPANAA